jgi:hypothetical protein
MRRETIQQLLIDALEADDVLVAEEWQAMLDLMDANGWLVMEV